MLKKLTIVCGHYGCGKTNFALNLAADAKKTGQPVTLVDLDIVNPYFRSGDYREFLERNGITVITPWSAGTTLDSPSLTAQMFSVFDREGYVIFDVGGDDVGASVLGRFSKLFESQPEYSMLFVINKYRHLIAAPEDAAQLLAEVEAASKLRATGLINNSHLCTQTVAEDILASVDYALGVAEKTGLALLATTAPKSLADELNGKIENLYPVDVIVKLLWNT
ncbi:MAG: ParA family protein [Clostridiales bacterium]|nr:ParA family protein [Clostridiales bacterium]